MSDGCRVVSAVPLIVLVFGLTFTAADEPTGALVPLPETIPASGDNEATPKKIALGRQLFFDARLSGDNSLSCASCHIPDKGFADGRRVASGREGKDLTRNTPTVLNLAWQKSFFWDGRAETLEAQAFGPITSPDEMNQNLDELERELNAVPGYVRQFREVYGTQVTREGVAHALAAFQRTLVTRNSPLDRYLKGEADALSPLAVRGLELFTGQAGCVRCHNGPLLSDGEFYRLGVSGRDVGRAAVTGRSDDRYRFRTPSLRDVGRTAPYMHNGSLATLEQVVEFYLRGVPPRGPEGLSLDIEPAFDVSFTDIEALVAFLKSLDGELPEIEIPELP